MKMVNRCGTKTEMHSIQDAVLSFINNDSSHMICYSSWLNMKWAATKSTLHNPSYEVS